VAQVAIGETAGAEIANMPGSKKKKSKKKAPTPSTSKRALPKKTLKKAPKPAKKAPAKKVVAKKKAPARKPQRKASPAAPRQAFKAFADKVRDCEAGTPIWFLTAGSVEHAAIQRRGGDGAMVILTDAGVTEVVPERNLFETADEARAARYG
jgi:hypothetical protein